MNENYETNIQQHGLNFISAVLDRPIEPNEAESFTDIIDRLSDEVWDLCANN